MIENIFYFSAIFGLAFSSVCIILILYHFTVFGYKAGSCFTDAFAKLRKRLNAIIDKIFYGILDGLMEREKNVINIITENKKEECSMIICLRSKIEEILKDRLHGAEEDFDNTVDEIINVIEKDVKKALSACFYDEDSGNKKL